MLQTCKHARGHIVVFPQPEYIGINIAQKKFDRILSYKVAQQSTWLGTIDCKAIEHSWILGYLLPFLSTETCWIFPKEGAFHIVYLKQTMAPLMEEGLNFT